MWAWHWELCCGLLLFLWRVSLTIGSSNLYANMTGRWCGKAKDYCSAPDCQINYGSGCDGNKKPQGLDTFSISRPKVGRVPYGGAGVYECVKTGDIALTFDDGPYLYTSDLLDKMKVSDCLMYTSL
jgi:hypothetical protein